jgi:tetratricopeptide (TPR) repeat protein
MPGEVPPPGPVSQDANSTPPLAQLGVRTPAGWTPLAAEQPHPPPVIPDYTVVRRIGGGAYGEVWLARNFTGSHFAIKVVHRSLFDHDRPYERELAGIRRFEPISRSHPSQVAIHHVGHNPDQGYFYYVMDLADDAEAEVGEAGSLELGVRSPEIEVLGRPESPAPSSHPRTPNSKLQTPNCNLRTPDHYVPKTLKHLLRTRGRLPFAECLDIGLALTTALEHLHSHGLVHRDIKPSNVIFVGGVPKLADIGLVTSIDATQSFVGTEGFFPPEGPGTAQADIFSLGKLLYEIATGKDRREFPELPADLATTEEQARLSELNAIILKACQHDPEKRYATAAALNADLDRLRRGRSVKRQRAWQRRWDRARKLALPAALGIVGVLAAVTLWRSQPGTATTSESAQPRVRVANSPGSAVLNPRAIFILPIRPTETNGAPLDLCSRITDAFIDSLGLLTNHGITVGPRKSGWAHLPEAEQFQRVTNEFRMRHALSGNARLTDDQYALTLDWWDLELGQPRWTETFRGATNELIELERHAVLKLAQTFDLEIALEQIDEISQLLTNNLEALGYLQKAKAVYAELGASQIGCNEAMRFTQPALRRDPRYVEALYMDIYMARNIAQERFALEEWPSIVQRVDALLGLDNTHADALDQRSGFALLLQRDWSTHNTFAARCLQSQPRPRYHWYKAFYLRIYGRFDEARVEQLASETPEPNDPDHRFFMAASRWAERDYDGGMRMARRTIEMYPTGFDSYLYLAQCLVGKGDYAEGVQAIDTARRIFERQDLTALLGIAYARMGEQAKAREVLQELLSQQTTRPYLQPYFVARVYAALGEKQLALDWLEKADADCSEYLFYPDWGGLRTDYAWDTLQDEPRYWKLCDSLGLGNDQWPRKEQLP